MYKGDRTRWLSEKRHPELVAQYRFVRAKRQCEYWANKNKVVYLFVRFIYEHYKVKYNTNVKFKKNDKKTFTTLYICSMIYLKIVWRK